MFKGVRKIESSHPVVVLFAEVTDLDALRQELEHRSKTFAGRSTTLRLYFESKGQTCDTSKFFWNPSGQKKQLLTKIEPLFYEFLRIVDVDLNREVRRCYKCQDYGHTQMLCLNSDAEFPLGGSGPGSSTRLLTNLSGKNFDTFTQICLRNQTWEIEKEDMYILERRG
jgi:hypothetical protein